MGDSMVPGIISKSFDTGYYNATLRILFELVEENEISLYTAAVKSSLRLKAFEKKYNGYLNGEDVFRKNRAKNRKELAPHPVNRNSTERG